MPTPPTPAGARLTVTDPPIPDEEGIILPPGVQGYDVQCKVVFEVGDAVTLPVQAGDRVYFHDGYFAKIGEVLVVGEDAILAYEKR